MSYIAKYYSTDTWKVEETAKFPTIVDVKLHARGRVYTLTVEAPRTATYNIVGEFLRTSAEAIALCLFTSAVWVWAAYLVR